MINDHNKHNFRKTFLSAAITTVISASALVDVQADIYEFSFTSSNSRSDAVFTMLDPGGIPLQNTAYPYYGDTTWGYGLRSQVNGSLAIDSTTGLGSGAILPFEFFSGGAMVPSDIRLKDVPEGDDPGGFLWLSNMMFSWGGSDISTQVVFDFSGLFAELSTITVNDVIDAADCGISGACAIPASDGIKKGKYPIGPVPVATSSFNIVGATGYGTTMSQLSLGADDGIGGSPMDNGPFSGYNLNFDFGTLTLAGYNDTTAPVLSLGSSSITIPLGRVFDPNNPGVGVSCVDAADGDDDITNAVGVNPNISFAVSGSPVDGNTEGSYQVNYFCTDNAGSRVAVNNDPNNPGSSTVPVDNTSASKTLMVIVSSVDSPVISVTGSNPHTHEACTVYSDAGATAVDAQEGNLTASIVVTDTNLIIGNSPDDGIYTINYDVIDSGAGNPGGVPLAATTQRRTVNVIDTLDPVITITGGAAVTIESSQSASYIIPIATAVDANGDCNPVVGGMAITSDTVDFTIPVGQDSLQSTLRYFAYDTAIIPNQSQANQVVTVQRSEPIITLIGGKVILKAGDAYIEQGMNVHDVQDGDLSAVTTSGTTVGTGAGANNLTHNIVIRDASSTIVPFIDTSLDNARYTVSYDVTDSDANSATMAIRNVTVGVFAEASNFTMLAASGYPFSTGGSGTNDVIFDWDGTFNAGETDTDFSKMFISSALPQPFFSYLWTAHHIRVFGPGTYFFDTTCTIAQLESGIALCYNPLGVGQTERFLAMIVGAGQVGMHMLFDWGYSNISSPCGVQTCDTDIVNVWDQNAVWNDPDGTLSQKNDLFLGEAGSAPDPAQYWKLVSTDGNGDGINGIPMVDGPLIGFNANFNAGPGGILTSDSDGDGIYDSLDNCPNASNSSQSDRGGLDSNSPDGIGDACQCGDISGDGKITYSDSVLMKRYLLGLPSNFNADFCDVNGDGQCTNTDAVIIQRAILGLPPGLSQTCVAAGN